VSLFTLPLCVPVTVIEYGDPALVIGVVVETDTVAVGLQLLEHEDEESEHDAPGAVVVHDKLTTGPETKVTSTVTDLELPCEITAKSSGRATLKSVGLTFRFTLALDVVPPPVPLIVIS
jgi:hypothetical protein